MDFSEFIKSQECSAFGCWDDATRKGMCGKHYQAERAAGRIGKPCGDPFCVYGAVARGLCRKHYYEYRKEDSLPEREERPVECRECGKPVKAKGLCSAHYSKERRDNAV